MGLGAFGPIRGFDSMDVEMDAAGMVRRARQHALERADDIRGAALRRLAAIGPVIPGLGVHECFGMEHRDVVIVGKALGDLAQALSSTARSALGSAEYRSASAAISACSLSPALPARACACCSAASAGALA